MKKIYPTLLSAIILSMGSLSAQNALHKEIHLSTTGSLQKELSLEEAKGLTSIKVTGEINETDIALLNNMASAGKLEKIDLSEATFGETKDPLLLDVSQYFLPMIAALKTDDIDAMEAYEAGLGHEKDPRSAPGFWTFFTKKEMFFMTGYMRGWDMKINEAVLKTQNAALVRSPQIRSWLKTMGYEYRNARTDGDLIFKNEETNIWCLLHFTPYSKTDFPGIHFSSDEYEVW